MRNNLEDYEPVAERIYAFRQAHPPNAGWAIATEVLAWEPLRVMARIIDPKGITVATGHATSALKEAKALEKTETVAVGRALVFAGFAAKKSIASRDEMEQWHDESGSEPEPAATPGQMTAIEFGDSVANALDCIAVDPPVTFPDLEAFLAGKGKGSVAEIPLENRTPMLVWLKSHSAAKAITAWRAANGAKPHQLGD